MSGFTVFLFPALFLIGWGTVASYQLLDPQEVAEPKIPFHIDQKSSDNIRIVGGHEADIKDYPWQVSFIGNITIKRNESRGSFFCGGFIISENYILTAAHCTVNLNASNVELRAGSSYRKNGTIIPIAEVITHPDYDNPAFDNDVGVMKTKSPITFTDWIQAIKLPPTGSTVEPGSTISVSGFGKTKHEANTIPDRLMAVEIQVVHHLYCAFIFPTVITDNMWCAETFIFGGKGTCQGDSGSAAIQNRYAKGVVSFGRVCGGALSPSVFTDLTSAKIRSFIKKYTGL